eukprot:g2477.t1
MTTFRGLQNFISEIRKCASKSDEQTRVLKEMANIRQKFSQKQKKLNSYNNMKYVWKMCYIWMLGYEVDFGHMQVISLITGLKLSEKQVGYLAMTLLIQQNDELMSLLINGVRNDLLKGSNFVKSMAVTCIANTRYPQLAEVVGTEIYKILVNVKTPSTLRKKAAVCLLAVTRATPDTPFPEEWLPSIVELIEHRSLGVAISVCALLVHLLQGSDDARKALSGSLPDRVVLKLQQLVLIGTCPREYVYKKIPCPWLQVKLLRILQFFPMPQRGTSQARLDDVLSRILSRTPETTRDVNRSNSEHSILFEAVNLIIRYKDDVDERLKIKASSILGRYIQIRDANLRYLGLAAMARLAASEGATSYIKKHQATILYGLKDPDLSIRKRALNLLFLMCDKSNSLVVVKELLSHLANADVSIREEMVLKIAILAERHAPNFKWYVDTILYIIRNSGSFIDDDIWHRACQIISVHDDLQSYAARTMYDAITDGTQVNEMLVRCAAYVLGEYGDSLEEGGDEVSVEDIFDVLRKLWDQSGNATRSIMVSSFAKLSVLSSAVETKARDMMRGLTTSIDLELQQRALEYLAILDGSVMPEDQMEKVLDKMPAFAEDKASNLVEAMQKKKPARQRVMTASKANDGEEEEEDDDGVDNDDDVDDTNDDDLLPGEEVTFSPSEAPKMRKWFMNLVSSNEIRGLLYDNATVQVGAALSFKGKLAKIQLYFGNKTDDTLSNFRVAVDKIPELMWKIESVKANVDPKEQVRQRVQLICVKPFAQSPRITITFRRGSTAHSYSLVLPITCLSFVVGKPMDSASFLTNWKSLTAAEQTEQKTVPSGGRGIADVTELFTSAKKLGLAQVAGIDTNGSSLTCAGLFETRTIKVGCMMRVDAMQNAFRVTVRTASGVLSSAICKTVVNLLK